MPQQRSHQGVVESVQSAPTYPALPLHGNLGWVGGPRRARLKPVRLSPWRLSITRVEQDHWARLSGGIEAGRALVVPSLVNDMDVTFKRPRRNHFPGQINRNRWL